MRLTVVIPVYNGEHYIAECLSSLLDQWVDGVEIIVVNDGSTDRTAEIIEANFRAPLAQQVLQHFENPNGGVSVARNCGLDAARGNYVAFVDADDAVAPNYLAVVLTAMNDAPDIVEFGYRSVSGEGAVLGAANYIHTKFGLHATTKVRDAVFASCLWYPFLRVIRRALFDGIRFPVGVRFCEDLMTISAIYKRSDTIRSIPDVLYSYRVNMAGATRNVGADYAQHLIAFYRTLPAAHGFANHALKISVAYAARSCLSKSTDSMARLPHDIERNLRWIPLHTPSLILAVRTRFLAYAVAGPYLLFLRETAIRLRLKRQLDAAHAVPRRKV